MQIIDENALPDEREMHYGVGSKAWTAISFFNSYGVFMHIGNFKIFIDLVETSSFSKAARLNGITQSAVSQQLRAMEKHFDVLIIDRSQKQLHLTPEGRCLFDAAKGILHQYDTLKGELLEMKRIVGGTVGIETIYSIGLHELPPLIKTFSANYPDVHFHVEYRRAAQIYDDVLKGDTDLGMVAFPQRHPLLEIVPFKEDRMVVICAPKHPFARRKGVAAAEVAGQPLVAFEGDIPTRKATDAFFRKAGLNPVPVLEFDNVETVKRAVEIGEGIAIVPEVTAAQEVRQHSLVCVPLKDGRMGRPLALIHRKGRALTPALRQFISLVAACGAPDAKKRIS